MFLDIWLPGIDGLETLRRLESEGRNAVVVMISGHGTIETAVRATKLGAFDFIEKPLSLEKTLLVLRNALRQRRLERTNRRLLSQLRRDLEIPGATEASAGLRRRIDAIAGSDAAVLLEGERGSGRETLARKLHAEGARSGGPFCDLSPRGLDDAAWARTLFGEDPRGIPGRLELAERGTLFVREADTLSATAAGSLADALSVERTPPRDLRLILSVRRLETLDPTLRFEADGIRIAVPPLRERADDISAIAERTMAELAREYGRKAPVFEPEATAAMTAYAWPGNLRELRAVVERLLLMGDGDSIALADLPRELGGAHPFGEDLYREFPSLEAGVRAFERFHMTRALAECDGDLERAAERLGLPSEAFERLRTMKQQV